MRHTAESGSNAAAARVLEALASTPAERAAITLAVGARRRHASAAAIALEAECVTAWHAHTRGSTKSVLPSRNIGFAREQGQGERGIMLGDLCEGITDGGDHGRAAARAVFETALRAIDDADKKAAEDASLDAAIAEFARESSDVSIARLRNRPDAELEREADEAIGMGQRLKAVIVARRRRATK